MMGGLRIPILEETWQNAHVDCWILNVTIEANYHYERIKGS